MTDYVELLDVLAVSNAIYRKHGYIKQPHNLVTSIYDDARIPNAEYIRLHYQGTKIVDTIDEDARVAANMVEFFEGLAFKKVERELSEFEENVLSSIAQKQISMKHIAITAVLPSIYASSKNFSAWDDMESKLLTESQFLGEENSKIVIEFKPLFMRSIPSKHLTFVAGTVDGRHIVKFHTHINLDINGRYTINGIVTSHKTSKYTRVRNTFIRPTRIRRSNKP